MPKLEVAIALYMVVAWRIVVQLFLQETARFHIDLWGMVGNRDHLPEASILVARLDRARNNMLEALPVFLALALLAWVHGVDKTNLTTNGALVFLVPHRIGRYLERQGLLIPRFSPECLPATHLAP